MRPVINVILGSLTSMVLGAWALTLYYEAPPIATAERRALTPAVEQGGYLTIENVWTYDKACALRLFKEVVTMDDKTTIFTGSEDRLREAQVPNRPMRRLTSIYISDFAAPGKAVYQTYASWSCNIIQALVPRPVANKPIYFTVVPKGSFQRGPKTYGR